MCLMTPGKTSKKKSPDEKQGTPLRRDSTTTDPVKELVRTDDLISWGVVKERSAMNTLVQAVDNLISPSLRY